MQTDALKTALATTFLMLLSACCVAPTTPQASSDTPATEAAAQQPLPRVLIIGDSISMAYTAPVTALLQGKADVARIPGNGEYTGTGLLRIDDWLGDTQWDVIHFNWGLWDMYGWEYAQEDRSPKAYEERLELLVTRMQETGATLIWATTTPACPQAEAAMLNRFDTELIITPEIEQQYRAAAQRVMARHNVKINDLHALLQPELATYALAPDNVHFTSEGYNKLAQQVADTITAVIED